MSQMFQSKHQLLACLFFFHRGNSRTADTTELIKSLKMEIVSLTEELKGKAPLRCLVCLVSLDHFIHFTNDWLINQIVIKYCQFYCFKEVQ